MSRYYYSKKTEADYLKKIEVSFLDKHGYFKQGWRSGNITWSRNGESTGNINIISNINDSEMSMNFNYTQTDRDSGEKEDFDYKIPVTTTPCYFGGKRYWFICPWYSNGIYCGKRVGVLYLGNKYFACRNCYNLTYESRNTSYGKNTPLYAMDLFFKIDKLKERIKRLFYRNLPTRKHIRLMKLHSRLAPLRSILEGNDSIYKSKQK